MRFNSRFSMLLLIFMAMLAFNLSARAETAHEAVARVTNELLGRMDELRPLYAKDPQLFYDAIDEALGDSIDYQRMAFLVMDREYYTAATPEQRDRFVQVFQQSLLQTYAKGLISFRNERVEVIQPTTDVSGLDNVDVEQRLYSEKGTFTIIYRMRLNEQKQWQLVNVTLEGINLGKTFRNQFEQAAVKYNGDLDRLIENWSLGGDV